MTISKKVRDARVLVEDIDELKKLEDIYFETDDDDLARACVRRGLAIICPRTISDMKLSETEEELEVAYTNFDNEQDWLQQSVLSNRYLESEQKKISKVDGLYDFYTCKFLKKKIKAKLAMLGLYANRHHSSFDDVNNLSRILILLE